MDGLLAALDASLWDQHHTGDSAYWRGLIHGLASSESDAQLLLVFNGPVPPGIPAAPHLRPLALPRVSSRWHSLVRLPLLARRAGAQVVHTQYNLSPLVRRGGVTTIHDVSFFIGPEWFPSRDRMLLQKFVPQSVARASAVITVSETSRREIEQFIPAARGKVTVTPNALSPTFCPPAREIAKSVARKLGLEEPFALTVGTRWPRKNMGLAVDAVARCASGLTLAVTGQPGWGDERFGSHVRATGFVTEEELAALYADSELYLAPSRHEGFGIPLLEAWATRTPVICSSGGALPEVAGDAAIVMPGWDAADWARAIDELQSDSGKVERLRELGTARLARFDWKTSAQITLNTYREAARR